ncbi:MAG: hypothetical protein C4554_11110 [Dethiobacter sp.]|jgi:hypothetical protein|nr:MAG: hypothetical protein C4554_11110 [Dethiobacter sp.]
MCDSLAVKVSYGPKEIYGFPIKTVSVSIKDEAGVIGGLGVGLSLKNQDTLIDAAQSFASTSEEVVTSTEELSASANELAAGMEILNTVKGRNGRTSKQDRSDIELY